MNKDLQTLTDLNNALQNSSNSNNVQKSVINNPAQEVEKSLASFVTHRLDKITIDSTFEEVIKDQIRERLDEASFDQLMVLLDTLSKNNNKAAEVILHPFEQQVTEGKTLLDSLNNLDNNSVAARLYDTVDDKKVLQSVSYLSQILSGFIPKDENIKTIK